MDKPTLFNKLVLFTTSVHRVTHELTQNAKSDLITPVQYNILEYITVSQPVTPSEISDCLHVSMPNTSRELKKLSQKNLIEKINDNEDRRKQYVRLSSVGEDIMREAFENIESRFLARIQNSTQEDLKELEHALDVLQEKLFY